MPKQSWDDMDDWIDRWVDYSQISVKSGKQVDVLQSLTSSVG